MKPSSIGRFPSLRCDDAIRRREQENSEILRLNIFDLIDNLINYLII